MKKRVLFVILFFLSLYLVSSMQNYPMVSCGNTEDSANCTDSKLYMINITNDTSKVYNHSKITAQTCDANTPCEEGLECYKFPFIGLRCAEPNPCDWYFCGLYNECVILESYPAQVNCVKKEEYSNMTQVRERIREMMNYTFSPYQKMNESECLQGCECAGGVISCQTQNMRTINITAGDSGGYIYMYMEQSGTNASSKVEIEIYSSTGNTTRLRVQMRNGENIEIEVMPDEASETFMRRLRIRECNTENNCTIELKELEEKRQLVYEIRAERRAKILGIFNKRMRVLAEVNAENGEIVRVEKPWWAFLASEPEE